MYYKERQEQNLKAPIHGAKKLIRKIGIQNPVNISLLKLNQTERNIKLIELAWVLAICEGKYENFGSIDHDTEHLYSKFTVSADNWLDKLHEEIIKLLPDKTEKISPWYIPGTSELSFKVSSNVLLSIFKSVEEFKDVINTEETSQHQSKQSINLNLIQNNVQIQQSNMHVHSNIDARTFNTYISNEKEHIDQNKSYRGDAIAVAIVTIILPKILPDIKQKLSREDINKLCDNIFNQLTEVLNSTGATVTNNLPKKAKKDGQIKGHDKDGNEINTSHENVSKRIKNTLLDAYIHNLSPHNI